MKKNNTTLDIQISKAVDHVYGFDKFDEKKRKVMYKNLKKESKQTIKSDKAKMKLFKFIKTSSGQLFVNELRRIPIRMLCPKYHLDYVLIWKNDSKVYDLIDEVVKRAKVAPEIKTFPDNYGTWEWNDSNSKPIPKNLTSKPTYEVYYEWNTYRDKDTSLPTYKHWKLTRKLPSEIGIFDKKNIIKKLMDRTEFIRRLTEHKMAKWYALHPKPDSRADLFPEMLDQAWSARELEARSHILAFNTLKYDKNALPVIGRFKADEDKYIERPIGYVLDPHHNADNMNDSEDNCVIKDARELFTTFRKNNPSIICARIQNRDKTLGQILVA